LLEWSWALDVLASARNAWLATVTPAGHPHAAPLWIVVDDETLWFWTLPSSAKGRNLAADDHVVLHVESDDDVVIVNGRASLRLPSTGVVAAYASKYAAHDLDPAAHWTIDVDSALAWQGHLGSAQVNATRFTRTAG
jgi:pyridoxine/pyridoxamine 5'-phosphate oxidase